MTQLRIILFLCLVGGGWFGLHKLAEHYRDQGRDEVRAEWDKDNIRTKQIHDKAIAVREAENKVITLKYEQARENSDDLQQKLQEQSAVYKRDLASKRAGGGLRVSADICAGFAAKTKIASAETIDGASDIRLPDRVEESLYTIAEEGDRCRLRLDAVQTWIREAGLFEVPNERTP